MITRTLTISTIHYSEATIDENGNPQFVPQSDEYVNGKITKDKAINLLRKKYGDKMRFIKDIEVESTRYGMSLEDFLEYAKPLDNKDTNSSETITEDNPEGEGADVASDDFNVDSSDSETLEDATPPW